MQQFLPNAKHVFMERESAPRAKRLLVMGKPSPVPVSTLLKEVAAAWAHELPGSVPRGVEAGAFCECLLIAAQAIERAFDDETATSLLHDAKNMIRDARETIENVKSEVGSKQNRRLQHELDVSAQSLADMADLCSDLLRRWRSRAALSVPDAP
jgi:hypothetical protein